MPRQRGHVSAGISTLVPSARSTFPMNLATLRFYGEFGRKE
jgi:hypothetical protein